MVFIVRNPLKSGINVSLLLICYDREVTWVNISFASIHGIPLTGLARSGYFQWQTNKQTHVVSTDSIQQKYKKNEIQTFTRMCQTFISFLGTIESLKLEAGWSVSLS